MSHGPCSVVAEAHVHADVSAHTLDRAGDDIQERLGVDVNYASQYRLRLIAAELIESSSRGYVDFALPYLREYLRDEAAADI